MCQFTANFHILPPLPGRPEGEIIDEKKRWGKRAYLQQLLPASSHLATHRNCKPRSLSVHLRQTNPQISPMKLSQPVMRNRTNMELGE